MTKGASQEEYNLGKILSESWNKFKENFQSILLITLIIYIPINAVLAFVPIEGLMEQQGNWQGVRTYLRIMQVLEGFIGIIATMAIAYLIKSSLDNNNVTYSEALKKSLSRWGAAIITTFILGLFIFGLTLLLIVPGIIFYVFWIFAPLVVILKDKSGKSALDYSKSIVKGRWWKVALYSLVFGFLGLISGLLAGASFWFLPDNFLTSVLIDTVIDIVASFFTVVSVIFFINLDSTKKEVVKA